MDMRGSGIYSLTIDLDFVCTNSDCDEDNLNSWGFVDDWGKVSATCKFCGHDCEWEDQMIGGQ